MDGSFSMVFRVPARSTVASDWISALETMSYSELLNEGASTPVKLVPSDNNGVSMSIYVKSEIDAGKVGLQHNSMECGQRPLGRRHIPVLHLDLLVICLCIHLSCLWR
jgi:hypothetical protein